MPGWKRLPIWSSAERLWRKYARSKIALWRIIAEVVRCNCAKTWFCDVIMRICDTIHRNRRHRSAHCGWFDVNARNCTAESPLCRITSQNRYCAELHRDLSADDHMGFYRRLQTERCRCPSSCLTHVHPAIRFAQWGIIGRRICFWLRIIAQLPWSEKKTGYILS